MKYLRTYPLSLFCIALIWFLCLFKPPSTRLDTIEGFDKVVHIVMYLGTCTVIWWEYLRRHCRLNGKRLLVFAVVLPILMSGIIELTQEYATDCRSGDWADFAANSLGALLGAAAGYGILRPYLLRKKTNRTTRHNKNT